MPTDHKKQGVVAIIQKSGKYLFVRRSDYIKDLEGYWCPVSGRIEKNESQAEAIQREVLEEVGLNVVAVKKHCEIPSHDGEFDLHFWTTKIISGTAQVSSDEITAVKWVTPVEMKKLKPIFKDDIKIFQSLK